MKLTELTEASQVRVEDIFSPEEMEAAKEAIADPNKDWKEFEDLFAYRLREKGIDVVMNMSPWFRFMNEIKRGPSEEQPTLNRPGAISAPASFQWQRDK